MAHVAGGCRVWQCGRRRSEAGAGGGPGAASRGQVGLPPSLALVRGATSRREGPESQHPETEGLPTPPLSCRVAVWVAQLPRGSAPSRAQRRTGPGEGRLPPGPSGHLDGWWGVGAHTGVPPHGPCAAPACGEVGTPLDGPQVSESRVEPGRARRLGVGGELAEGMHTWALGAMRGCGRQGFWKLLRQSLWEWNAPPPPLPSPPLPLTVSQVSPGLRHVFFLCAMWHVGF